MSGDEPKQRPGPVTMMKAKDELDRQRAKEERAANDARDVRTGDRIDEAYQLALEAAKSGQAVAERTTRMLYLLLAASMLANVVLMAMKYDKGLDVSKEGVSVGAPESP